MRWRVGGLNDIQSFAQLGAERGPNGEPSTNDFQVFELLRIVDRFAADWGDSNPSIGVGEL